MSDGIQIKLTGTVDVIAAFRELREELPKNPMRRATRAAATYLAQFIALTAPKLTGRLARNIGVRVTATHDGITHGRVVVKTIGARGSPENAFYWRFLEEGWRTKRGQFRQFPFIRNVFDAKNREAAQIVIDECEAQVKKAQAHLDRTARSA